MYYEGTFASQKNGKSTKTQFYVALILKRIRAKANQLSARRLKILNYQLSFLCVFIYNISQGKGGRKMSDQSSKKHFDGAVVVETNNHGLRQFMVSCLDWDIEKVAKIFIDIFFDIFNQHRFLDRTKNKNEMRIMHELIRDGTAICGFEFFKMRMWGLEPCVLLYSSHHPLQLCQNILYTLLRLRRPRSSCNLSVASSKYPHIFCRKYIRQSPSPISSRPTFFSIRLVDTITHFVDCQRNAPLRQTFRT